MVVNDYADFIEKGTRRLESLTSGNSNTSEEYRTYDLRSTLGSWSGNNVPNGTGSGRVLNLDHREILKKSREVYHDSMEVSTIIQRKVDTFIDTGLILDPQPNYEILGITPEKAVEWSKYLKVRFHNWFSRKGCHRSEVHNGYQLQRLMMLCQQRDNDYFVRFFYSRDRRLQNPLQMQLIDPTQIQGDAYTITHGPQFNVDGINRDAAGREVSYDISQMNPKTGKYKITTVPAFDKSGRRMMLHAFRSEYPGQQRGFSSISTILQRALDITSYQVSEVKKAIIQASITMTNESKSDRDASKPFEDLVNSGFSGPRSTTDGEAPIQDNGINVDYVDVPEATFTQPGVAVFNLKGKEQLKPFASTAPAEEYARFVDSLYSHLSANQSISKEVVLMLFGDNYSASRATLELCWRIAQIFRADLETDVLDIVVEMFVANEIALGRMKAPGWSDPILRAAWMHNRWIGSPMPDIDPLKHSKSNAIDAQWGAQTLDDWALNKNRSDGQLNRAKLAKQYEELPIPPFKVQEALETSDSEGEE